MPSPADERTPLIPNPSSTSLPLERWYSPTCHESSHTHHECDHGTTSTHAISATSSRPTSPPLGPSHAHRDSHSSRSFGHGGPSPKRSSNISHKMLGDAVAEGVLGDGVSSSHQERTNGIRESEDIFKTPALSTTQYLAQRHGVKGRRKMYLSYYFPFLNWIVQYKWAYLQGDALAAITMASFYIPMALSYAENLGHIPPINGLYSFVFNPAIYALFGTCPRMVVGPEAAGSLLVGSVVRTSVDVGSHSDEDMLMNARVAGVVTGMAGAVILIAGLTRLGFLDSVLSRPFLRGFISAIGWVIMVDQLIPELGLGKRVRNAHGVSHASSATKVKFLFQNIQHVHGLTAAVAFSSFTVIMVSRCVFAGGNSPMFADKLSSEKQRSDSNSGIPKWRTYRTGSSWWSSRQFSHGGSIGKGKASPFWGRSSLARVHRSRFVSHSFRRI